MASYLDKARINTAITENTKLDLGHQHITTADFMQCNVSYLHEMVPGERIDVNMESFARLNPLPVPTFGRASMRNRAFFVPFRTIFRGWNDFITDAPHVWSDNKSSSSIIMSVPYVDNSAFVSLFVDSAAESIDDIDGESLMYVVDIVPGSDVSYDLYYDGDYLNFTQKGRQFLKVIESLGYKINWYAEDETEFSALPLIALGRVICDWYYPQPYTGTYEYNYLMRLCNADAGSNLSLDSVMLFWLLDMASYVQYDSDYFVSAFDTPNQPVANAHSVFKIENIDSVEQLYNRPTSATGLVYTASSSGYVANTANATANSTNTFTGADAPFISGVIPAKNSGSTFTVPAPISSYLIQALSSLTDYMKRHQLAGSRAMDRYLARFGKALPAEKLNRSYYLGCGTQDIQIGDIMSTSDTEGANLGAYAGKGMSYGNAHFDFSTEEYGYFIILSTIVPATGYFQGRDRQVMRLFKSQFWTPEFDSLGNQPVTADELYISPDNLMAGSNTYNQEAHSQVFGFVPRYADYKVARDYLTGNFRIPSLNGTNGTVAAGIGYNAADSWHLMRTFTDLDFAYDNDGTMTMSAPLCVHSLNFMRSRDWSQYKRIFYANSDVNPEELPDNFTVIHNFEIAAYAPMKALYDTYDFEDKGKSVTLDVNGVKMN